MRSNVNYTLIFLGVISAFAVLSIILILNVQTVYSKNPEVSYLDVNDTSSVSKFSVAAWFKTSNDYKSDAYIVNKAGDGGNMNYGIWMTDAEKIRGGFETSSGKPVYATSPISYSDGKWHYALVTFDGSIINLYVDGALVASELSSGGPDNGGNEPVRVGANSENPNDYFIGDVDEVRVWKIALNDQQVFNANNGKFDSRGQILYLDFSEPIVLLNETSTANQTATNATNATSVLNQTATNATSVLNQTATNATSVLNQTATNATFKVNKTANNETGLQGANKTAGKERSNLTDFITNNGSRNATANGTNENVQSIKKSQIKNDTGITNETLIVNQTSESRLSEENSIPKAFDQSVSVDQNNRIDITLVADDEDKDHLQYDITADPLQGSLDSFNKEKGTVTYIPGKDYSGDDKFSFRASDNKGGVSEPANVDIQINIASQLNETGTKDTGAAKSEKLNNQTGTEQTAETNTVEQPNQPPKADAGGDQKVEVNTEVKLDGGKSSDGDGKIVSYEWKQSDGPEVNVKNADGETATFDIPESAADSKLSFKLTVVDDKDASSSDDVNVEVEQAQNVPPKADAGGDQKVEVNSQIKLDGGKSSDEDGKIVSYEWKQSNGPDVKLKNADEETATFDIPESAADSKLSFKLTVADDKDASNSDDVKVEVEKIAQDDSNTKDGSNNKGKSN